MRAYLAFTKKEFTEFTRTYKLLILGAVFLLFGMMNPLTAKLIPVLLANFMPEGVQITLGEPTALDSWMQFYKNVPQMGLFVVVIIFSSIMANEYSHGTLINMLTKGLYRRTVILSKFTMSVLMWTAAYALCFVISYAYTAYFWDGYGLTSIVFAAFALWIYGIFLLSIILFGGVLFKNGYGSLLFTGFLVVIQFLLNIIPKVSEYNPLYLATKNLTLIQGVVSKADFALPIVVTLALSAALIVMAIAVFNKKAF